MNKIFCIKAFTDNYIWLLTNPGNQTAVVVDPGDAAPVIDILEENKLSLTDILITHHHADHVGGVNTLVAQYGAEVYGPKAESIPCCDHRLAQGDHIQLKNIGADFKIIEIPGHTSGHIAYYGHSMLFCGDTLFAGGCGRLFEGTAEQMLGSLSKIKALPDDTAIYCAHEYTEQNLAFAKTVDQNNAALDERIEWARKYRKNDIPTIPSTLRIEKETNPFLRTASQAIQASAERENGASLGSEVEVFSTIRKMKDSY